MTAWMMCKLLEEAGRTTCHRLKIFSNKLPFFIIISAFCSAGVPPGVVNVVFGTGQRAGDALVGHPDVPLISFTGSTATAQRITERSAPYCKKLSLELGGKNPAIIFADADLEQCIETTIRSSFSNQVRQS